MVELSPQGWQKDSNLVYAFVFSESDSLAAAAPGMGIRFSVQFPDLSAHGWLRPVPDLCRDGHLFLRCDHLWQYQPALPAIVRKGTDSLVRDRDSRSAGFCWSGAGRPVCLDIQPVVPGWDTPRLQ